MQSYFDGLEPASGCGEGAEFSLYPNPTTDRVTVNLDACYSNGTVTVVNALGQVVFPAIQFHSQSVQVNLSGLPAGVYFLILDAGLEKEAVERVVKL